jgi:protoporphyrinogen oxidase
LGGRINTVYRDDGLLYDTGAGRFNDSHTELLKLLKELGLKDKAMPITNNQRSFVKDGKEQPYKDLVGGLLFQKVLKQRTQYSNEYLKSITLLELMTKILGAEKTQDVISAFGYNSEFEVHNAYTALEIFEHDFNDKIQYYYLKGGLAQIIVSLHKNVVELGGHVHLNTSVNHYDPTSNVIEYVSPNLKKAKKMVCDKVLFCVTHDCLARFEDLLEYDDKLTRFLDGTQSAPLHRIFAQFPVDKEGKAWFHNLQRTTTNANIRYIIPHNPSNGFMQVSYTDNSFATYWHNMSKEIGRAHV